MPISQPYIVAALWYSDFTMCEFIEHLEMSKALTQYDNSIMQFVMSLNLLVIAYFVKIEF